jgi:GNAT superfamily N-acetyltransferase
MYNSITPDPSFTLRRFQPDDSTQVLRLVESVLAEFGFGLGGHDDDWDIEKAAEFYAPPASAFLVLESGDDIVGTVGIKHRSDTEAELRRMYLRHDLRGYGHGKRLLFGALEFARSQRCETIFLETSQKLERAIGLYEAFGFILTDRPGEHSGHLVYEKSLVQRG